MMAPTVVLGRRRRRARARQRGLQPHPLGDPADDRRRRRPRAVACATRSTRRACTSRTASCSPSPGSTSTALRAGRVDRAAVPRAERVLRRRAGGRARRGDRRAHRRRRPAARRRRRRGMRRRALALALTLGLRRLRAAGRPTSSSVTRGGSIPGAKLRLRVTDDGHVSCNGGALREISSKQLIDARVLARDLDQAGRRQHVSLPAKPGSTLGYAFTIDGDTTRFADNASGQSADMYAAALLVRELAQGAVPVAALMPAMSRIRGANGSCVLSSCTGEPPRLDPDERARRPVGRVVHVHQGRARRRLAVRRRLGAPRRWRRSCCCRSPTGAARWPSCARTPATIAVPRRSSRSPRRSC